MTVNRTAKFKLRVYSAHANEPSFLIFLDNEFEPCCSIQNFSATMFLVVDLLYRSKRNGEASISLEFPQTPKLYVELKRKVWITWLKEVDSTTQLQFLQNLHSAVKNIE